MREYGDLQTLGASEWQVWSGCVEMRGERPDVSQHPALESAPQPILHNTLESPPLVHTILHKTQPPPPEQQNRQLKLPTLACWHTCTMMKMTMANIGNVGFVTIRIVGASRSLHK